MFKNRFIQIIALLGVSLSASAQQYPTHAITIVVPFSPGGNGDLRARQLAATAAKELGQPVVVENRPGAGGNVGMNYVARADPDGYTLGMGAIGPLATNKFLYPSMPYDPATAFDPILLVEKAPLALSTRADKPYKSVKDVVDAARSKPGQISIGNTGQGGAHHLSAEIFEQAAHIDMLGVPYKGGGPASNALLSGEVEMMFELTYAALPYQQAKKSRILAVTSDARLKEIPDVPTMTELGYPQVKVSYWIGLVGPKGMPPAIVKRLSQVFGKILAGAEMRSRIESVGSVVGGGTPADFATFMESERKRWEPIIKERHLTLE